MICSGYTPSSITITSPGLEADIAAPGAQPEQPTGSIGALAVAPSNKHLERYDIALLVPALRENTNLRCTVGQTGRVFFEARPLDWLRGVLN